jgi:RNA polymerase sigma factor (sigma-70 family)
VRAGLEPSLARLWRYALVFSRARDVADDLVQATCLRAIERADQFVPGTRVDRWLFAILRSIWLNEIRSQRIREGRGFIDAEETLTTDGVREIENEYNGFRSVNSYSPPPGGAARDRPAGLRRRVQLRLSGDAPRPYRGRS